MLIFRARAPLRIELVGGTDVDPWSVERGAYVVGAAINKYSTVSVYDRINDAKDRAVIVDSVDLGVGNHRLVATKPVSEEEATASVRARRAGGGEPGRSEIAQAMRNEAALSALKACMNLFGLDQDSGIYIHSSSDSPPGTGLGTSSANIVATLAALGAWKEAKDGTGSSIISSTAAEFVPEYTGDASRMAIMKLAWEIERKVLGQPGGWQDHVAAALGGFYAVKAKPGSEFPFPGAEVDRWWPSVDVVAELEFCSLLAYVGRRTGSGASYIQMLQGGMKSDALVRSLSKAEEVHKSIRRGDVSALGVQVDEGWRAKLRAANGLTNDRIARLYRLAIASGAIGGTLCGAGGGGFLYLYCEPQAKHVVANELEKERVHTWPFSFERDGLQVWQVPEGGGHPL